LIGILEALDKPTPIGTARVIGRTEVSPVGRRLARCLGLSGNYLMRLIEPHDMENVLYPRTVQATPLASSNA